jgi:hypothetical protein
VSIDAFGIDNVLLGVGDRDQAGTLAPLAEPFEVRSGWTVEVAGAWGNVPGLTDYTKEPARGRR